MTKKQLLDKLVLILESEDANNTLTFETALEQYIRSKENILSPSTIRGYRILQRNAYDYINNLTLSEINELVLQKWANHNAIKFFCTDNAAMIGVCGYYDYINGVRSGLDLNAVPGLKIGTRQG